MVVGSSLLALAFLASLAARRPHGCSLVVANCDQPGVSCEITPRPTMYPKESDREYKIGTFGAHTKNTRLQNRFFGPDGAVLQVRVAVSAPIEVDTEQMLRVQLFRVLADNRCFISVKGLVYTIAST